MLSERASNVGIAIGAGRAPDSLHTPEPGSSTRGDPNLPGTSSTFGNRLVVRLGKAESSVELPGVSERRPVAFPIDTGPNTEDPVFVYSPLRGEWTIGVRAEGTWFDRATGEEIQRPTHWMALPEPLL
jgi:hypothetical protein